MSGPEFPFRHALVIGGTGMLLDAAARLASSALLSTSVARSEASQARLAARLDDPARHRAVRLDWAYRAGFLDWLADILGRVPQPDIVLAWLHDASLIIDILRLIRSAGAHPRVLHVIGSASSNPLELARAVRARIGEADAAGYRQIVLGYADSPTGTRWLTDAEICEGVMLSLQSGRREVIVGEVKEWQRRP